jgi:hypothetical protein
MLWVAQKIKLSVWERIEMKSADHAHPKKSRRSGFYVFITVCPICRREISSRSMLGVAPKTASSTGSTRKL